MAKLTAKHPARRRDRGMSLIEILVGLVIGMIGIVVIFQVLAVAEGRKRTTVQGSDAQSAGAIALYSLKQDVQLGGYGFSTADPNQIGCLVRANRSATVVDFRLYPVEIVQGAGGAPDTLQVLRGNSTYAVGSRSWTQVGAMKRMTGGRGGLDYGDLLIVTGTTGTPTDCALIQVTDRPVGDPQDVGHDGDYTLNGGDPPLTLCPSVHPFPPNCVTATPIFNNPPAVFTPASGFVFNLGKQPRRTVWSINANRLMVAETLAGAPTVEAADGIVNLQAEYGCDTNNDQVVAGSEWTTAIPGVPPDWRCVRAIRVALLARSTQWDRNACSPNPQWTSGASGALVLTNFAMTNIDGSAGAAAVATTSCPLPPDANDWRQYRYSVYETVIPLRNMIWGTAP